MAFSNSTGFRNAILNSVANAGSGFAEIFKDSVIEIYAGTRPASADSAVSGSTLLGTLTLAGGAFTPGIATNGLNWDAAIDGSIDKPAADVWQFTGVAAGVAAWFRIKGNAVDAGASSTVSVRIDGSIASFGGDATLSDTNIAVGKVYTASKCKFIWPA